MAAETRLSITRSLDFSFFFPEKTVWTFWNFSVFYDLCLCVCVLSHFSHFWLCVTLGTVAHQAPPSMGFSRQEYWVAIAAAAAKSYQSCPTVQPHRPQLTRLLCPWDSPGKNTGVGCHCLLQGIFLTHGMNLCLLRLLHCRQILCCWATREAHDL